MVAIALNAPKTEAAPDMSNFISSMPGGCLSEMPPVSKVMPLPTSATGASPFVPPAYSSTMSRAGSSEPRVTERNEPMPRRLISRSSRTRTLTDLCAFASVAGGLGEIARRADVGRQVGEVLHAGDAGRNADAVPDAALRGGEVRVRHDDAEARELRPRGLLRRS